MKRDLKTTTRSATRPWDDHLRGHALLFPTPRWGDIDAVTGARLLMVAAGLELSRISALMWLHPVVPWWVIAPMLLAVTVTAIALVTRLRLGQVGFRRWRDWSRVERSYFVQIMSAAAFLLVLLVLARIESTGGLATPQVELATIFAPYLLFGFYQELIYRGAIQRELVRRWGAPSGILVANGLYTFGPLHWTYFGAPAGVAGPMLLSVFLIGLFFGVLYYRSGNMWLAGWFHAVGNAMIVWQYSTGSAA